MCAYARRCFASCTNGIHPIDGSHVYLLMQQTCIITAIRREPLTHPVESDNDCAPQSISDTEDWLNWNGDLDNPNDIEEDCAAADESDIEHNNGIEDPECPEQQNMSAAPNVPGLVRPTRKSKRQAEKVLVTVNAVETRRNKGGKKK